MKTYITALVVLLGLSISAYADTDKPFDVYFDVTAPFFMDNDRLVFDGVRVEGFDFTPSNDALRLEYLFDYNSLNFNLQMEDIKVYSGAGIFHEENMAINVEPTQPDYIVNGKTYRCGETYDFEAATSQSFVAELNLKAGHVISWLIRGPSNDYLYHFSGGDYDPVFFGEKSQGVISDAYKILADGSYTLAVEPRNSLILAFSLKIFNANNRTLEAIGNNTSISVSFESSIRDYSKYKVSLNKGDLLTVPKQNSDIVLKLVDNFGRDVAKVTGLPLIYQAEKSGDYYLFIQNSRALGGSYRGTISITPAAEVRTRLNLFRREGKRITFDNATPALLD